MPPMMMLEKSTFAIQEFIGLLPRVTSLHFFIGNESLEEASIKMNSRESPLKFKVYVSDIRVSDLPVFDPKDGAPDPYVVFNFDSAQFRTPHVKGSCNPVFPEWNAETTIECASHDLLVSRQLSIEVWNKKSFSKDALLCYAVIDYKSLALGPTANSLSLCLADNPSVLAGHISFNIKFEETEDSLFEFSKVSIKIGKLTGFEPRYNISAKWMLEHKDLNMRPGNFHKYTCGLLLPSTKSRTFRNTSIASFDNIPGNLRFNECSMASYVRHNMMVKIMHRTIVGLPRCLGVAKIDLEKHIPKMDRTFSLSSKIVCSRTGDDIGTISFTVNPVQFPIYAQLVDGVRNVHGVWGKQISSQLEKPYNYQGTKPKQRR
ncbi:hypothetical protein P9112_000822 [Eukaryota sp. TZLM1-RC]